MLTPVFYIFEFDTLDELRRFDSSYVSNTRSVILKNLAERLNVSEADKNVKAFKDKNNAAAGFTFVAGRNYKYFVTVQVVRKPEAAGAALSRRLLQPLTDYLNSYSISIKLRKLRKWYVK